MLEVPFYACERRKCTQAAMKSVLKARLPGKDFSLEELEKLTEHSGAQLTLPCQAAYAFFNLRIPFTYYVKSSFQKSGNRSFFVEELKRTWEKYEEVLAHLNLDFVLKSINELKNSENIIVTEQKPRVMDIEQRIDEGRI